MLSFGERYQFLSIPKRSHKAASTLYWKKNLNLGSNELFLKNFCLQITFPSTFKSAVNLHTKCKKHWHTNTQTNTQTHKHTNTNTQTQTHKHTNRQSLRNTDIDLRLFESALRPQNRLSCQFCFPSYFAVFAKK
jgi:hypothetical protein